ncbi:MAG: hypothetical protein WAX77_10150 [Methylococcaceae bacterium]
MKPAKSYAPVLTLAIIALLNSQSLNAAPRAAAGNDKAIAKLQAMVQSITAERDTLKAETAKINADLEKVQADLKKQTEQLQQQLEQEKSAALAALSASDRLNGELNAQKSSTAAVQGQLSNTAEKLRAMTAQYEEAVKVNQSLNAQHAHLQTVQTTTATNLNTCETKNLKLYETTKAMIDQYHSAQNKNLLDKVIESEPLFKLDDVATETMLQDYQDQLNKQKLKAKIN